MSVALPSPDLARTISAAKPRQGSTTYSVVLLALAGVLFIVYPATRPYSSEVGTAGAAAFGSDRWVLAHVAGMVAFGALVAGCGLLTSSRWVKASMALGVGLILPYYGAETFGLHAIGEAAAQHGAANLAEAADAVRFHPAAIVTFVAGWMAIAVAGVALARELWSRRARLAAVLVGAGLTMYLPQFSGPSWIRILHGVILGVGLVVAAMGAIGLMSDD